MSFRANSRKQNSPISLEKNLHTVFIHCLKVGGCQGCPGTFISRITIFGFTAPVKEK